MGGVKERGGRKRSEKELNEEVEEKMRGGRKRGSLEEAMYKTKASFDRGV